MIREGKGCDPRGDLCADCADVRQINGNAMVAMTGDMFRRPGPGGEGEGLGVSGFYDGLGEQVRVKEDPGCRQTPGVGQCLADCAIRMVNLKGTVGLMYQLTGIYATGFPPTLSVSPVTGCGLEVLQVTIPYRRSTSGRNHPVGQQQLLLIILGVIVVAIAVAVGITMFTDSAASSNREAVAGDLQFLAQRAQQFYRRPTFMGGGGNSFSQLTTGSISLLTSHPSDANGSYFIESAGTGSGTGALVVIQGIGTELFNGSPVAAHIYVYPDHDSLATIN